MCRLSKIVYLVLGLLIGVTSCYPINASEWERRKKPRFSIGIDGDEESVDIKIFMHKKFGKERYEIRDRFNRRKGFIDKNEDGSFTIRDRFNSIKGKIK